jgi:hypothetical protein
MITTTLRCGATGCKTLVTRRVPRDSMFCAACRHLFGKELWASNARVQKAIQVVGEMEKRPRSTVDRRLRDGFRAFCNDDVMEEYE